METPVITDSVSHYTVLKKLGAGGMGEVYLAEDTVLNRRVAIKFLPEDSGADHKAKQRLIREAQAAARLDHPNICTIHEVGEEAGRSFIVMQYVDGETLASRIRNRPLDLKECLEIVVQVADALSEAHSHGIIHRDIKPQNIMLTDRHHVKVMDFGLAKVIRDRSLVDDEAVTESLLTGPGAIVGTVPYVSPEQVRGERLDARSDIFSFGAVLYEMVTGHQAFAAESGAMIISAIVSREPAPLTRYSSDVPPELQRIVSKALHKDLDERYQTTRDLLIDLRSLKHHLEIEKELEHSGAPHGDEERSTSDFRTARPETSAEYLVGEIKHHKRSVIIGLCALMLAVAAAAYFFYFAPTAKAIDSIAVLPLANVSGDPNTEYLSDGISEALINSLTELRQLRVMARATAFRYKGKEVDPQAVGRELNVRAVLTGRVRQVGDALNIQVDLVDTSTGAELWGREYERKLSDVLAVKQDIAREITEKLRFRLSGEEQKQLGKRDTTNAEAYQFYLRGRYFWNKRTAEGLKKAIEQFQQAADKDPNYALAYVGLADCYVILEEYTSVSWSESRQKATEAVERALQLDDSLAEAHASLAVLEKDSWQWDKAENEFKRAIALNPNYPTAHHWYGIHLRMSGRSDESMREIRRAQELDPLSPVIQVNLVAELFIRGDIDAAAAACVKLIEFDPNYPLAHGWMGWIYQAQARYDDAISELQKWVDLSGRQSEPLGALGQVYALAGQREKATAIRAELEERYARRETNALPIASVYAGMRDYDKCFAWLEKDFQARSGTLSLIPYRPTFDLIRSDPRYASLLDRMGLTQFIEAHDNT